MAEQHFDEKNNRFWIDLHKCATGEAENNISSRINECYQYGINEIEVIYGTPDQYEGSIQEMIDEIADKNPIVDTISEFHAGCVLIFKKNPNPEPQDEYMRFSPMSAKYEYWRKEMSYNYYYPLRTILSTAEVSNIIGCSIEYIRKVAENLPFNHLAMPN